MFRSLDFFRQKLLAVGLELADKHGQTFGIGGEYVDLDDVSQRDEGDKRRCDIDDVVEGQAESLVMEIAAAFNDIGRRFDRFQYFQNDEFWWQGLDQVGEEELAIDVDVGPIGAKGIADRELRKGVGNDCGGGLRCVEDLGGVGGGDYPVAKQQFVGQQLLFSSKDWLPAEKDLGGLRFGHVFGFRRRQVFSRARLLAQVSARDRQLFA